MPSVVPVTADLFPEVHEGVLRALNPAIPVEVWRRAFEPRGWGDEEHFGFAMSEGGRLVGLMGTLFSRREVEGRSVRFCNLHSWYVQPEFRGPASLLLLRPVLALKETTLTDFSATPDVLALLGRMGFAGLGNAILVLPPLPGGVGGPRVIDLDADPDPAVGRLSTVDREILHDHRGIGCRHLMVEDGDGYCYVVASVVDGARPPHAHVHYVSDPALLARHHRAFRRALLRGGLRFASIPARLMRGVRLPWAIRARGGETLVRPGGVPPHAVDTLYSEMALLKLPVVPRIPEPILAVRRWLRGLGI